MQASLQGPTINFLFFEIFSNIDLFSFYLIESNSKEKFKIPAGFPAGIDTQAL